MPTRFDLPSLSDKTYASLQQELTAAIPQYSRQWTDFNASDPGIALLQLLCWLGDTTLYRIDTLPRELYLNFLRLVVGASGPDLATLIRTLERNVARDPQGNIIRLPPRNYVVLDPDRLALARYLAGIEAGAAFDPADLRARVLAFWRSPYRLVTTEDIAAVTRSVTDALTDLPAGYAIRRVEVVADAPWLRVLPVLDTAWKWRLQNWPGSTRFEPLMPLAMVTAVFGLDGFSQVDTTYARVLEAVRAYLAPRRLLGTPLTVETPVMTPLAIRLQCAAISSRRDPSTIGTDVYNAIQALLSPFTGGPDGTGWPYDRPVLDNDIRAAVLGVAGVDANQPVQIAVETITGLQVGRAAVGWDYMVGPPTFLGRPDRAGLPQLWLLVVEVLDKSYEPIEIAVRSTVGVDTRLPLTKVWS